MAENAFLWSITAADNDDADPAVSWPEGMLPGAVNNSARATMAGVARMLNDLNGSITTTGSSNAYLATANSGHTTYTSGTLLTIKASFTNTGAATLDMTGSAGALGAKSIRVFGPGGETDVSPGMMQSGGAYQLRYDSALNSAAGAWLLLNPTTVPKIGAIEVWPTDTLPAGYLWCNGGAVSRTTYASLFGVISTTFGVGDNSTTFNVPDLCGRAPFGSDDMGGISAKGRITNAGSSIVGTTLAASGGAEAITLSTAQIPSHTHTGTTASDGAHTHTATTSSDGAHTHTINVSDSGHSHQINTRAHANIGLGGGLVAVDGGTPWADPGYGVAGASNTSTTGITASSVSNGAHTHTLTSSSNGAHTHTFTSDATGGGTSHSNMPPALIVNYIIRY